MTLTPITGNHKLTKVEQSMRQTTIAPCGHNGCGNDFQCQYQSFAQRRKNEQATAERLANADANKHLRKTTSTRTKRTSGTQRGRKYASVFVSNDARFAGTYPIGGKNHAVRRQRIAKNRLPSFTMYTDGWSDEQRKGLL